MPANRPPTRVLIVDDSAVVRKLIGDALKKDPDIEVIGGASDPFVARELILQHKPDLITLDIEMPRMDGLTFLRRLMAHHPVPTIMISSLTQTGSAASVEALRIGAIDVIGKASGPQSVSEVTARLVQRIHAFRATPQVHVRRTAVPAPDPATGAPARHAAEVARRARGIIAIGASTGGTQALETVLSRLPADSPGIVVVQHMPAGFTKAFADRLNSVCALRVTESAGGEPLERGTVYIAPGNYHLSVEQVGVHLRTRLHQEAPEHYQRPAVDVLFRSIARLRGHAVVGLLLTGMGSDGADGMVAMRQAGAITIAEAEESCVVFGMPKEAIDRGGAVHVASLLAMPSLIFESFDRIARAKAS